MKQMISNTMAGLLEHKSVDKITVKELVEACGISRQAFYYHFQDIMDVIEWAMAQALQEAVDVSLAAPTPQEALETVILSLRKNKRMIQHLMSSQRRSEIERLLVQAMDAYLAKMLRAKPGGKTGRHRDRHPFLLLWTGGDAGGEPGQRASGPRIGRPALRSAHRRLLERQVPALTPAPPLLLP